MARQLYIEKAVFVANFNVELKFNDGTVQNIDFEPFLKNHPHPQYNKYQKPQNFKSFHLENGNIVWGKNWDLMFPIENLYCGKLL